jgi:signal transduction histidine kinase/ActR/RegA family two-component response regulator
LSRRPPRWRDWPWVARLALLLGALAILPLTVVALVNAAAGRAEAIAAARAQDLQQARNTAQTLDEYLDGVRSDVRLTALAPWTARFLAGPPDPALAADVRLALRQTRDTQGFDALYLTDGSGVVRLASDDRFLGRPYLAAPWVRDALAGNAGFDEPRYDPLDGRIVIRASAPVRDGEGRIVGAAVGRISLAGIDRIIAGDTGFAGRQEFGILLDADGVRLSHPTKPALRFRALEPLPPDVLDRLAVDDRFGPGTRELVNGGPPLPGIRQRALWLLYDRTADPHLRIVSGGRAYHAALVPLQGERWLYGVFTPEDAILAAVQEAARCNLLLAALTALVAAATAYLASRWVAGPLRRVVAEQTAALRASEEELRALYEREQAARRRAEEANRLKDEFLSTVSHELRTPLNAILGWTWLLDSGKLDAEASRRARATIERNARAQGQIIDDLLDVSRIITGKLRLRIEPVDLQQVVEAALESIRPAADAKEIAISRHFDAGAARLPGDPQRLQQVVWNLLSNAVKFTPRGGRMEVHVARRDAHVELRVTDSGVGIRPDFLDHVFDRFRQADSSSTRTHGGLGLGLAIVRHLVELHGGTVVAHSDGEGRGATFAVSLPVPAQEPPAPTEPPTPATPRPEAEVPPDLQGVRVLLVDDDPETRRMLPLTLETFGAEVTAAASAAEALAILLREPMDVMVADIGMPEEDGYSLIGKVRALDGELGSLPALALTAYAAEADRQQALAAGFHLHMAKPVEPLHLASALAALRKREGR